MANIIDKLSNLAASIPTKEEKLIGQGGKTWSAPDLGAMFAGTGVGKKSIALDKAMGKKFGKAWDIAKATGKFGADIATYLPATVLGAAKNVGELSGRNLQEDIKGGLKGVSPLKAIKRQAELGAAALPAGVALVGGGLAGKATKGMKIATAGQRILKGAATGGLMGGMIGGTGEGSTAVIENEPVQQAIKKTMLGVLKGGASGAVVGGALAGAGEVGKGIQGKINERKLQAAYKKELPILQEQIDIAKVKQRITPDEADRLAEHIRSYSRAGGYSKVNFKDTATSRLMNEGLTYGEATKIVNRQANRWTDPVTYGYPNGEVKIETPTKVYVTLKGDVAENANRQGTTKAFSSQDEATDWLMQRGKYAAQAAEAPKPSVALERATEKVTSEAEAITNAKKAAGYPVHEGGYPNMREITKAEYTATGKAKSDMGVLSALKTDNPKWFSGENKRFFGDKGYTAVTAGDSGNPFLVRSTTQFSDMFGRENTKTVYRVNAIETGADGKLKVGDLLDNEFGTLAEAKAFLAKDPLAKQAAGAVEGAAKKGQEGFARLFGDVGEKPREVNTNTIQDWVSRIEKISPHYNFSTTEGPKYIKLISEPKNGAGRSVFAFVDKATGEVYKPAGWQAPAKNVRGNIFDVGDEGVGEYGAKYMNELGARKTVTPATPSKNPFTATNEEAVTAYGNALKKAPNPVTAAQQTISKLQLPADVEKYAKAVLSNDESSTDAELVKRLQENGKMTTKAAETLVGLRDTFLNNIVPNKSGQAGFAKLFGEVGTKKPAYPSVTKLMQFEDGTLSEKDTIKLFQDLVDSGMAWQLQGSYGRQAQAMIDAGVIKLPQTNAADAYGNKVPTQAEYETGKGAAATSKLNKLKAQKGAVALPAGVGRAAANVAGLAGLPVAAAGAMKVGKAIGKKAQEVAGALQRRLK
jgi:hypothetical protein